MKKKLALVLSVMLCLALLGGCGKTAAESSAGSSGGETSAGKSEADESTSDKSETAGKTEDQKAGSDLRVAWICDGQLTDGGWNEEGFATFNALADEYGFELSYQEAVSSTEVVDVLRNYGAGGYDLVISNYQFHCEDMASIAPEFPDVTFACVNGYVSTDNMIAITGDMWQHIYLSGIMAGAVTKTNKLGLITYSTDSDSAVTMRVAWEAGAKSINPDIELVHVATGSFSDLAIGKEMAISLIDQGCDVIMANSGDCNATVMEVCIENGVYTISSLADRNYMDPDYVLGSALLPSSNLTRLIVDGFIDGSMTGSSDVVVLGIAEGAEEYRVNPDIQIDQSVRDALDQATEDIISGKVVLEIP